MAQYCNGCFRRFYQCRQLLAFLLHYCHLPPLWFSPLQIEYRLRFRNRCLLSQTQNLTWKHKNHWRILRLVRLTHVNYTCFQMHFTQAYFPVYYPCYSLSLIATSARLKPPLTIWNTLVSQAIRGSQYVLGSPHRRWNHGTPTDIHMNILKNV